MIWSLYRKPMKNKFDNFKISRMYFFRCHKEILYLQWHYYSRRSAEYLCKVSLIFVGNKIQLITKYPVLIYIPMCKQYIDKTCV